MTSTKRGLSLAAGTDGANGKNSTDIPKDNVNK